MPARSLSERSPVPFRTAQVQNTIGSQPLLNKPSLRSPGLSPSSI
ncbi:MAG: restriction endonuclease, SacI family [Planctomycetota bacterium]|nr:MAG: restriction endonuclease, SacI family [Planctomycetota bacterium]